MVITNVAKSTPKSNVVTGESAAITSVVFELISETNPDGNVNIFFY